MSHLDDDVRRADPDRWLASRFVADETARADLIALYAFNSEVARAPAASAQPLIAQMRLAFWREAVEEMFEGKRVGAHPAAQALAVAVQRRTLPRDGLEALIDARHRDLDGWPLKPVEVEPYIDATAGRLMALAARLLDPATDPHDIKHAARAWGLGGLSRTAGRLPPEWAEPEIRHRIAEALTLVRADIRRLPVAAFPAVSYATLTIRNDPEPVKRLRLVWATVTGRI
ncbi:MAG: squalene/phytoene synthase family protein [Caulobacteraceae bacterium]